MARNTATYPMKLAKPSPAARKSGQLPRYHKLFAQALALLQGHPYGTSVLITEYTTETGAKSTAKDIVSGKVKIAPAPDGSFWHVEPVIEDVIVDKGDGDHEVVTVSRLYAWLVEDDEQIDDG